MIDTRKDLKKEELFDKIKWFDEIFETAKNMIIGFVSDFFGEVELQKTINALKQINHSYEPYRENEYYYAYSEMNNDIKIYLDYLLDDKEEIDYIATAIHEIFHELGNITSDRDENINIIFEEGLAETFTEMVINHHIYKDRDTPCISEEKLKNLKENKYYSEAYEVNSYVVRSFLYAFINKGKEMEALRKYIFTTNNEFKDFCKNVLGDEAVEIIKDLDDYEEDYLAEYDMPILSIANLVERSMEGICNDKISTENKKINYKEMYYKQNPALLLAFNSYFIKKIFECKDDKVIYKKIKNINQELSENFTSCFTNYGLTDSMKDVISFWHKTCGNDSEKFKTILNVSGVIPVTEVEKIIEKEDSSKIDFDFVCNKYAEFKVQIDQDAIEYLLKYYDANNKEHRALIYDLISFNINPNLGWQESKLLNEIDFTPEEQNKVFKFYFENENVMDFINLLDSKDILEKDIEDSNPNIKEGFIELGNTIGNSFYDIQDVIDFSKTFQPDSQECLKKIAKENINSYNLYYNVEKAIDDINSKYYDMKKEKYIINKNDILNKIENEDYANIQFECVEEPVNLFLFKSDNGCQNALLKVMLDKYIKNAPGYTKEMQETVTKFMERDPTSTDVILPYVKDKINEYNKEIFNNNNEINEDLER